MQSREFLGILDEEEKSHVICNIAMSMEKVALVVKDKMVTSLLTSWRSVFPLLHDIRMS